MEPRSWVALVDECGQPKGMNHMTELMLQGKTHDIPKRLVWDAWLRVKENKGAAGADGVTIERFEADLRGNLYQLWNRMSSGSYFPGLVRAVEIPKKGGIRILGVPNIVDRIAQTVVVLALEPKLEKVFHDDSFGYRPGRSALDAVAVCRERCFKNDWVIDMDIRAFFDSMPWELTQKAVAHHTDSKWVLIYVERWLKSPMLMTDGTLKRRTMGTPQGGPISPLLANLFLHYGFDVWMTREYPGIAFERYADDVIVHCVSERQARYVRAAVAKRLAKVGLELHPNKTKIAYCKDGRRRRSHAVISFTFLGYAFRPREAFDKTRKRAFTGFLPGVSAEKLTEMSRRARAWKLNRRTTLTLAELAEAINPVLAGWLAYFTRFYPTAVIPLCKRINRHLIRWAKRKYKRLERSGKRARAWLVAVAKRAPRLFAHWKYCATT